MASLSTCHLGLWLGWQILLNLVKVNTLVFIMSPSVVIKGMHVEWATNVHVKFDSCFMSLSFQSSRHSLRRMTSMPPGWTEEQCDSGDVFFINDVTKERVSFVTLLFTCFMDIKNTVVCL